MIELKGKIIIVTGGNGLLGKAIVDSITEHGGVPVVFDIECDKVENADFVNVDITEFSSLKSAFDTVYKQYGSIDGIVNNAYPRTKDWGIDFELDVDLESWKANIDLQLGSYVACCQYVLKIMKHQGHGSIINIASIYGIVGNDPTLYIGTDINPPAPYSAIKGGLINFTRFLAAKYGKQGIRVNCVSPGGIFDFQNEKFVKRYSERVPAGRMGDPSDISDPVSFLLSDSAKYITGHNLVVDGGWTIV